MIEQQSRRVKIGLPTKAKSGEQQASEVTRRRPSPRTRVRPRRPLLGPQDYRLTVTAGSNTCPEPVLNSRAASARRFGIVGGFTRAGGRGLRRAMVEPVPPRRSLDGRHGRLRTSGRRRGHLATIVWNGRHSEAARRARGRVNRGDAVGTGLAQALRVEQPRRPGGTCEAMGVGVCCEPGSGLRRL